MRIDTTQWNPEQRKLWDNLSLQVQGAMAQQGPEQVLNWVNQQLQTAAMHLRGTVGAGQLTGRGDKIRNPGTQAQVADPGLQSGLQDILKMAQRGLLAGAQAPRAPQASGAAQAAQMPPAQPFSLLNLLGLFGPSSLQPRPSAADAGQRQPLFPSGVLTQKVADAATNWRQGGADLPLQMPSFGLTQSPDAAPLGMRKTWQAGPGGLQHYRDTAVNLGANGLEAAGQTGFRFGRALESGSVFKHDLAQLGFGSRAALEATGDLRGHAVLDQNGLRATADANAVLGGEVSGTGQLNTALFDAAAGAKANAQLFAQGKGDLTVDKSGAALDLTGKVGATAGVEAQARIKTAGVPFGGEELNLNAQVRGRAEVTAQAEGRVTAAAKIAPPRAVVDIGGKAFAGARAEVEGSVGLGDFVKLKGHAGAWAGAGAEGNITFGFDDGKLRFGLKGGAAVGYGVGVGGVIEVDIKKIANAAINTGLDAAQRGIKYALNPLAAAKDAAQLVASLPQKAAKAADTVLRTGASVIKTATDGIKSLAKKLFG